MTESDKAGWTTRVTAVLALTLEVIAFLEKPLKIGFITDHHEDIEKVGIVIFLLSIISWLEASKKALAKLDHMAAELKVLTAEAKQVDWIARYGAGAVSLAQLLNPQGPDVLRFPHCTAGGATLSHLLLNTYTQVALEFHRFRSGGTQEVKLIEASIITLFLRKLLESLPPGSVWLGISRLQESGAWEEKKAEPELYLFEQTIEHQIKFKGLIYLRVLCFEDDVRYQKMQHIATHQKSLGLHVGITIKNNLPEDMSLVWVPRGKSSAKFDLSDPIGFLEKHSANYEPLCGLRFGVRADRELNRMDLVGPDGNGFVELKMAFSETWKLAKTHRSEELAQRVGS